MTTTELDHLVAHIRALLQASHDRGDGPHGRTIHAVLQATTQLRAHARSSQVVRVHIPPRRDQRDEEVG